MTESSRPKRSCADCPSFLSPTEAAVKFRKSIGAPVCGRYGIPLGRPGSQPGQSEKIQTHVGTNCDAWGSPARSTPERIEFEVAIPDMRVYSKASIDPARQEMCKSCSTCSNFIRDDVVAGDFGWPAGLCAARGKLILPNMQIIEARDCDWRQFGPVRLNTDGMDLLPLYADGFGTVNVFKAYASVAQGNVNEPSEYPSDREVSEQDEKDGIRAWRRVPDPDGSAETFLPIYRTDFFSEAEQQLIPKTGSDEHPELYADHFGGVYLAAVCWSELDETPALWGEAGTGKTELFRHLAWLMNLPFRRISITGSTELDDLAGKMRYTPEAGTYFKYGRLPDAWGRPGVLCLDEPNTAMPEVWQFLRPLTDNSKQLVLDQNEGEIVDRHTDCYLGMAMNPYWDPKNVGTMALGDADANRLFHVMVPLPPERLEVEIIKARVALDGWELATPQIKLLMGVAKDLRALIEEGGLTISWAIRPQIKVARALRWFSPQVAYRRAIGDYLEPQALEVLLNVVRTHAETSSSR